MLDGFPLEDLSEADQIHLLAEATKAAVQVTQADLERAYADNREMYSTPEQIRAAHRELMKLMHPDRGGSSEAFQAVQDAYAALQNRVCPDCGGKGFITTRQGFFVSKTPCPKCWKT